MFQQVGGLGVAQAVNADKAVDPVDTGLLGANVLGEWEGVGFLVDSRSSLNKKGKLN